MFIVSKTTMNDTDKDKKRFAEKEYRRWLKVTECIVGPSTTSNTTLNKAGSIMFGDRYKGTFAADKIPRINKNSGAIVNTDKSGLPGSHWVGLTHNRHYDSFGRPFATLFPDAKIHKDDTEYDIEQHHDETNCGARCLAFLAVDMLHGDGISMFI